jgi:elongator complex protein 2
LAEAQKLYGHESELIRVSATGADDASMVVASTCKARTAKQAAIRLWNSDGQCIGVPKGQHQSSVTALEFSPCGLFLARGGKDRRLCIWQKGNNQDFLLAGTKFPAHKRIIWDLSWSSTSNTLATALRDGFVKLWNMTRNDNDETWSLACTHHFEPASKIGAPVVPIAALAFCPHFGNEHLLAVGLEQGSIKLWMICLDSTEDNACQLCKLVHKHDAHIGAVQHIKWRPMCAPIAAVGAAPLCFATCGLDHSIPIFWLEGS